MSKTFFNMSEKKQKIINFIKKHKNMLGVVVSGMTITDEYLNKLKNASTEEFFGLVNKVRLKSCPNFFIFYHDEKHHMSEIWLPDVLSKNASDKSINEFCDSNDFEDVIEIHSSWYNMTPKRWETFEAIFDFYDKQKKTTKTPVKKTAKKTAKKTVKKTAKIFFNSSEKKQKIINFIKKHKNILGVTEKVKDITDEYLSKLEKANNEEFLRLVHKVKLKFGQNFFIFSDNCDEKHPTIAIWLPTVLSKITSDKAIKEFCGINSFKDVIEKGYCYWYTMTPKRWKTFEAIFDFYDKQNSELAKQLFDLYDKPKTPAKKTAKTFFVKPKEVKLSDFARFKDDIVF